MKPEHQELIDKLPLDPLPTGPEPRRNPYSGVVCTLEPQAVVLYDFITNAVGIGPADTYGPLDVTYKGHTFPIRLWHRARYLFAELWPDEYMDLID